MERETELLGVSEEVEVVLALGLLCALDKVVKMIQIKAIYNTILYMMIFV